MNSSRDRHALGETTPRSRARSKPPTLSPRARWLRWTLFEVSLFILICSATSTSSMSLSFPLTFYQNPLPLPLPNNQLPWPAPPLLPNTSLVLLSRTLTTRKRTILSSVGRAPSRRLTMGPATSGRSTSGIRRGLRWIWTFRSGALAMA
jgi:hypothetical protein